MIHVIAEIQVVSGKREEFLKIFHELVPQVRAEAGCLEYGPAVDMANAVEGQVAARTDLVTVLEKWQDLPALEIHLMAPHMHTFRAAVRELVSSVELRVLQPA